jgi:endonuclease YncB( thermonuclease family)
MKTILLLILFCVPIYADVTGRIVGVTDGDTFKVLDANNTLHKGFCRIFP